MSTNITGSVLNRQIVQSSLSPTPMDVPVCLLTFALLSISAA